MRKTLLIIALCALTFTAGSFLTGTKADHDATGCPDGYVDCFGVCQPYACTD